MHSPDAVVPLFRLRMAFDSLVAFRRSAIASVVPVYRTSMVALLVAVSYYVGSQIGFLLTPAGTPISTFWPPNAILLAAFLLTPPRIWWVLVLAVLPAHFLIQLNSGIPMLTSLGFLAGNAGEALAGAVGIRLFRKEKPLFESYHGVVIFLVFGVILAPLITSFVDAGSAIWIGQGKTYWMLWVTRLTTNMVAVLTVVPPVVIFGGSGLAWFRHANFARYFEAGLLTAAVVAVGFLAFGREGRPGGIATAVIYAPLLFLVWAALRFGAGGLSASMLGVALISSWNAVHGRGLLGVSSADRVISLHILLTVFAAPLMLTAALMEENRRGKETLRNTRHNLICSQEQEGCRVAQRLRDDIIQRLTLIGLGVDRLRTESQAPVRHSLDQLYDEIWSVFRDLLDLSHEADPFLVEYLGLAPALERLCQKTATESGMTIDFSAEDVPLSFPSDVSRRLFRVAKEALCKLTRQSQARTAAVELKASGERVILRIALDAVVMDTQSDGERLIWMREQVLSLSGTFRVTSASGQGTVIEASVPLGRVFP